MESRFGSGTGVGAETGMETETETETDSDTGTETETTTGMLIRCLVYGEPVSQIFLVDISNTETTTVGAFKEVIKTEKTSRFHNVDAKNLNLYYVSCMDSAHLHDTLKRWTPDDKICLDPLRALSDLNLSDYCHCIIAHGSYDDGACLSSHFIILLQVPRSRYSPHGRKLLGAR